MQIESLAVNVRLAILSKASNKARFVFMTRRSVFFCFAFAT